MDFGRECLVFVKGIEKTDEIAELGQIGASISIKYKGKDLIYSYDTNGVTIISAPEVIDLTDGTVLYENNIPLSDVTEVYKFTGYYSVYFTNVRRTYPEASIYVAKNMYDRNKMTDVSFVHPGSVLYRYLNGKRSATDVPDGKTIAYPFEYNLCEKEAIAKALSNDLSIIETPPGSLRAETIMNLIMNLAAVRGKTVAVVAKSNDSINSIYEKMKERGYEFFLARPGEYSLDVPEKGCSNEPVKGAAAGKAVSELNQTLEKYLELERREKTVQEMLSLYQLELKHFLVNKHDKPAKKISVLPWIKWDTEKTIGLWADIQLFVSENKETSLSSMYRNFIKYGIVDFDEALLKIDESIYLLQKSYLEGKIEELEKELKKIRAELKKRDFKRLLEYQNEISDQYIKSVLYERYHDISYDINWEGYREKEKFEEFLQRFPVVMCTSSYIRDSVRDNYIFDYLIMDEAELTDIQTGIQAFSCCRNAILVGNSFYPSSQSIQMSVNNVFGESVTNTLLQEHYPYSPDVIRFCNKKYYRGKLIPYKEARSIENVYSMQEIDTLKDEIISVSAETLGGIVPEGDKTDVARYIEYLTLDYSVSGNETIPVFDLLYRDLKAVLIPKEKRILKKYRYKSENIIFNLLCDIMTQNKYKDLRFNYNMRIADIVNCEDNPGREVDEALKHYYVDFTVYNKYEKKPKLVIEADGLVFNSKDPDHAKKIRIKDALLSSKGIHVIHLSENSRDEARHIIEGLDTAFFS